MFPFKELFSVKNFLTILSSREWNETARILPFGAKYLSAVARPSLISSNSLLTAILIAWKVLVAGSILSFLGAPKIE